MRNPFRSEAEAFSFAVLVAALGLVVALAGWLGGTWVALGLFLGLALGVVVGLFVRTEPRTREPAVWEQFAAARERRHILVVANETCAGQALLDEIRYRASGYDAEVLVVAPALSSHVRYWTSDIDDGRSAAKERLDASLAALAAAGIAARGEIGDADPLQAIEDALRTFGADEVIVSTHPPGRSNWLERDVVAAARERFDVPITHVVVDLEVVTQRAAAGSPARHATGHR
jgi:GABA permease